PGAAGAAAHEIAKEIFENIAETARAAKSSGSAAAIFEGGMAILVIGAAFLRILEDLICFVDFLESGFRFRVVRVAVGVVLHRLLAVSAFQRRGIDGPVH